MNGSAAAIAFEKPVFPIGFLLIVSPAASLSKMPGFPIVPCSFGCAAAIAFEMPAGFPIAFPLMGLRLLVVTGAAIVELVSIMIRKRQTEVKECIDK